MSYYEILYGYLERNELPWVGNVSDGDYPFFCDLVNAQASQNEARSCSERAISKPELKQLVIEFPVV